jgi:hypothetical protein
MPLEIIVFSVVSLVRSDNLLVESLEMRRKKPV